MKYYTILYITAESDCQNVTPDTDDGSSDENYADRASELHKRENVSTTEETATATNAAGELCEAALMSEIKLLREKIATERKEKRKALKQKAALESNLTKVFNKGQLACLSRGSKGGNSIGMKWSNETGKKGLQLRFACGSTGYDILLQLTEEKTRAH